MLTVTKMTEKRKRILVTGANGYIGQGVVRELKKYPIDIIAADYKFDSKEVDIKYVEKNLFDDDFVENVGHVDILLHLAWRDGFKHFSHTHIDDMPKHFAFLNKMIDAGTSQICCLGSMHEVGFYEGCIDENTPTNPISYYGIAKNALRQLLELLVKDKAITYQWIRGYYIVGNTHKGCSIFSKITEAEMRGDVKFPFTTGMNQYDFIDYDMFCKQIAATVMQQEVTGIINCCSGTPERLKDRVERFIEDSGYHIVLDYGAFQDRPYDSKAVWGSTKKIDAIMQEAVQ